MFNGYHFLTFLQHAKLIQEQFTIIHLETSRELSFYSLININTSNYNPIPTSTCIKHICHSIPFLHLLTFLHLYHVAKALVMACQGVLNCAPCWRHHLWHANRCCWDHDANCIIKPLVDVAHPIIMWHDVIYCPHKSGSPAYLVFFDH